MSERPADLPATEAEGPTRDVQRRPQIVSYAQNFEDVILWRALAAFGPGFYIDVGAGEPLADSVTHLFYSQGWRGINVEPMAEPFGRLREARPRDINLQVALENVAGQKTYFSVDDGNGLSTGSEALANRYSSDGREVRPVEVTVMTLAEVCKTFVSQEIHFLKLDVEGSEGLVLAGADFSLHRPWIVLIESTEFDAVGTTPAWHDGLAASNYTFVYFDGLNRFYVAAEKMDLLKLRLSSPPNWIDNFVTAREVDLAAQNASEISIRQSIEQQVTNLGEQLAEARQQLSALQTERTEQHRIQTDSDAIRESLAARVGSLTQELDVCYQQLFESSRQLGSMAQQRQNLVDRVTLSDRRLSDLDQELAALRRAYDAQNTEYEEARHRVAELLESTSWRLSAPLRRLSDLAHGRRYRS